MFSLQIGISVVKKILGTCLKNLGENRISCINLVGINSIMISQV